FYLDFAKDILYIEAADHPKRRSMQTVLHETIVSIVKLLSPIIPHTTEEVWEHINGVEEEYVQLSDMPEARDIEGFTEDDVAKWDHFMKVRSDVLKALEEARNEKIIGMPIEACITIDAIDEETMEVIDVIHII